jgi:hypothetical protein
VPAYTCTGNPEFIIKMNGVRGIEVNGGKHKNFKEVYDVVYRWKDKWINY